MTIVPPGTGTMLILTSDLGSVSTKGFAACCRAAQGKMNAETASAMHKKPVILFNLFLSLLIGRACGGESPNARTPENLTRYTYTEYHMGIDARIVVYAPDIRKAE